MPYPKHITQDGSEVFYFDGPGHKEWVGYKKYGVGVWTFTPYNGSPAKYTRDELEEVYPGFHIPNLQD